jgi:hypothetical protein
MSEQIDNFNPRLIIVNHFDDLINKIDVKTETSLEDIEVSNKKRKLEDETSYIETEAQKEFNEIRERQIEKIKEIEQINLQLLKDNSIKDLEQKWSNILDFQQKMDQIKEDLIHFDCVFLEQPKRTVWKNQTFLEESNPFILWITSWYYNKKDLEFIK